eukprot:6477500-Ditylum_brightwellii.AAC.1
MKSLLKRMIANADERGCRYTKDVKKKQKSKAQKKKRKKTVIESPGNILLSDPLDELDNGAKEKDDTSDMLSSKGSDGGSSL